MRQETRGIALPLSVTKGAAAPSTDLRERVAVIASTAAQDLQATYQLQVSWDGSVFVDYGSPLVFTGGSDDVQYVDLPFAVEWVRWDCTGFTDGLGASFLSGFNARTV
jgi:hypothetical protein